MAAIVRHIARRTLAQLNAIIRECNQDEATGLADLNAEEHAATAAPTDIALLLPLPGVSQQLIAT